MSQRFTVEREPPAGNPNRWIGHDNDGRICWIQAFVLANHFGSEGSAKSFIQQRLRGIVGPRVVAHTVH